MSHKKLQYSPDFIPTGHPALWFVRCGYYHVDASYAHDWKQGIAFTTVFLTISGQGWFSWKGSAEKPSGALSLSLLPAGQTPCGWGTAGDHWEFYWMHFIGSGPRDVARELGLALPVIGVPIPDGRAELIRHFCESLIPAKASSPEQVIHCQKKGWALLLEVFEGIAHDKFWKNRPLVYGKDLLTEIDRYLHRPRPEQDRVDELATRIGVSQDHLCRMIKKHLGVSPKEYFLNHRISQAKDLLIHKSLSIGEVGARLGYPDPYHFSKLFKARTGFSPRDYRKRASMIPTLRSETQSPTSSQTTQEG